MLSRIIINLSIYTDGSKFEFLKKFPLDKYKLRVMTSEHISKRNLDLIRDLLIHKGYQQIYQYISGGNDCFIL